RPILMTTTAMVAGMVPMAIGFGEGGEQTAPLGRAVIGGLVGATVATLFVLPAAFAALRGRNAAVTASIDPEDPTSRYYVPPAASANGDAPAAGEASPGRPIVKIRH
ncbi:MAG TPA: efflux RND transporter permease subunit, partial [Humisphaera sp.]